MVDSGLYTQKASPGLGGSDDTQKVTLPTIGILFSTLARSNLPSTYICLQDLKGSDNT